MTTLEEVSQSPSLVYDERVRHQGLCPLLVVAEIL